MYPMDSFSQCLESSGYLFAHHSCKTCWCHSLAPCALSLPVRHKSPSFRELRAFRTSRGILRANIRGPLSMNVSSTAVACFPLTQLLTSPSCQAQLSEAEHAKTIIYLMQDYPRPDWYQNNVDGGTNHDLSLCYVDCSVNLAHVLCVTTVTQHVCQSSEISPGRFKMNAPVAPILPHLHTCCIVLPLNWWAHPVIRRHVDLSKQENHKGSKNNRNSSHQVRHNSALAPKWKPSLQWQF